jgi:hypothetical protein
MYVSALVHGLHCIRFDATICYSDSAEILLSSNGNSHDADSGGAEGGGGCVSGKVRPYCQLSTMCRI